MILVLLSQGVARPIFYAVPVTEKLNWESVGSGVCRKPANHSLHNLHQRIPFSMASNS
jgi:hypothetical protein